MSYISSLMFQITSLALQVPVGRATLGRIINVIGEAIDERGEISKSFVETMTRNLPYCSE